MDLPIAWPACARWKGTDIHAPPVIAYWHVGDTGFTRVLRTPGDSLAELTGLSRTGRYLDGRLKFVEANRATSLTPHDPAAHNQDGEAS